MDICNSQYLVWFMDSHCANCGYNNRRLLWISTLDRGYQQYPRCRLKVDFAAHIYHVYGRHLIMWAAWAWALKTAKLQHTFTCSLVGLMFSHEFVMRSCAKLHVHIHTHAQVERYFHSHRPCYWSSTVYHASWHWHSNGSVFVNVVSTATQCQQQQ